MAYEFACALRATGWPPEDIDYARALWIGAEYSGNTLLRYLDAGFGAGYLGDPMPAARQVAAGSPQSESDLGECVTPDGLARPAQTAARRHI